MPTSATSTRGEKSPMSAENSPVKAQKDTTKHAQTPETHLTETQQALRKYLAGAFPELRLTFWGVNGLRLYLTTANPIEEKAYIGFKNKQTLAAPFISVLVTGEGWSQRRRALKNTLTPVLIATNRFLVQRGEVSDEGE